MLLPLLEARRLGLAVPATLLVKAFLDAHGVTPKGVVAHALDVSVRTVERALAELKELGLSFQKISSTGMTHDHVKQQEDLKGAPTASSVEGVGAVGAVGLDCPDDPLVNRLAEYGVLPWCVAIVMRDVPRDVIEQQLAFHAHRLATGFVERTPGGAAKMLFRACLQNFGAPKGFYEVAQRPAPEPAPSYVTSTASAPIRAPQAFPAPAPAPAPEPQPVPQPEAEMTLDGALATVRIGIKSRIPALRAHALELAARFQIDTRTLAG